MALLELVTHQAALHRRLKWPAVRYMDVEVVSYHGRKGVNRECLFVDVLRQMMGQRSKSRIERFPLHATVLTKPVYHLFGLSIDRLRGELTAPGLFIEGPLFLKFMVLMKLMQRNAGDSASCVSEPSQGPLLVPLGSWPGIVR